MKRRERPWGLKIFAAWRVVDAWVVSHRMNLGAWAALVAVVSLPLALVGGSLAFLQLRDALGSPDPELAFVHPASVAYKIKNASRKTAENVLVSFGIFDLDGATGNPLPLISRTYDYVNKHSEKGPFAWFSEFGVTGHRYFGFVMVGCRGGERLRGYWIYARHGDATSAFFAERSDQDPVDVDLAKLAANDDTYWERVVPRSRRRGVAAR